MTLVFQSPLFGIALTFFTFEVGLYLNKRFKSPFLNPIIIATIMCIAILQVGNIPLASYQVGGDFLSMLIFPATTCLAVAVYVQLPLLKKYFIPILIGCSVGATVSITSVLLFSKWFNVTDQLTKSLLPKSVTTAIALELSSLLQGEPSLTVMAVILTGFVGILFAPLLIKIFRIKDPIIQGLAIGTSSHVIGTSQAIEMGPIQGAMSGIAIFVTGVVTVILLVAF
ncbi:MAG: LrgB family protein [Sphaerochaetaceae bacterium]|jgi:predicted murein hydrolase (TIGR00659 family)|nr:LrgB family protein [Sphaerochaetaceae bacterium]MDD3366672.1 LrgB family protein [Sphaerochaetaceae bacterium]MDD4219154.1 LrgB family protein [Sphaerochaetaceae bacterium]MDY0370784.1 LrgB family protein [Sphaerochaetaceae bacterium]